MKKLTVDFIKSLGFKLNDTISEDDFYYEEYKLPVLDYTLVIFFNYHKDGRITYDVEMGDYELINVGKFELETLLKISPKNG